MSETSNTHIATINLLKQQLAEKEAENNDLQDRIDRYRHASEGASDGLWDCDLNKNISYVSKPWKSMLGIDSDENIELDGLWESLLHPDDKEKAITVFNKFIASKTTVYNSVFRLRHTDGSYKWIRSKAQKKINDQGEAHRVSGAHIDITEQREVVSALENSEKKYKALFQNSLIAIFRSKIDTGEIVEHNNKFLELIGYEKIDNLSTLDLYYDLNDRTWLIEELQKTGRVDQHEFRIKKADGTPTWVSFSAVMYPKDNFIEAVLIDVTKSNEDKAELQKVNFELDSFVYHSSHDLRSPLRSILGLINIYRHESDEYLKDEYIDRIERSINKLDHLVKELLSISRNDRINDPFVEINFMVEVEHSVDGYYNALNTDNLSLEVNVKQPNRFVSDLTRVKILLNNIISNAIKYRDPKKDLSKVVIDVEVNEQEAVIKIIDNGEGIPKDQLPLIFDMFHRASDHSEGSGLGLYIVKNVVSKLNAQISVTSEQFVETVFTITIPNALANR